MRRPGLGLRKLGHLGTGPGLTSQTEIIWAATRPMALPTACPDDVLADPVVDALTEQVGVALPVPLPQHVHQNLDPTLTCYTRWRCDSLNPGLADTALCPWLVLRL